MTKKEQGNAKRVECGVKCYREKFGRLFGAKRQKPGFPLQLLALPRCGVSAAIPGAWANSGKKCANAPGLTGKK
jgi:hypothetical protein